MSRQRVLFVDDEPALVALTVRGLSRLGYSVTGCNDPRQALAQFRSQPDAFDGVVTDLSMPSMSGLALVRELHEIRSDVPILMMSGYVTADDQKKLIASGVSEIVLKPIAFDKLCEAIDRVCARGGEHPAQSP